MFQVIEVGVYDRRLYSIDVVSRDNYVYRVLIKDFECFNPSWLNGLPWVNLQRDGILLLSPSEIQRKMPYRQLEKGEKLFNTVMSCITNNDVQFKDLEAEAPIILDNILSLSGFKADIEIRNGVKLLNTRNNPNQNREYSFSAKLSMRNKFRWISDSGHDDYNFIDESCPNLIKWRDKLRELEVKESKRSNLWVKIFVSGTKGDIVLEVSIQNTSLLAR